MAVIQKTLRHVDVDDAPLWLPDADALVVEHSAARPPDAVEGYSRRDQIAALCLGSRWKIAVTAAAVLVAGAFLAIVPSLFGAGLFGLFKLAVYQSWTLGLMLIITSRVRSVTTGTAARYWLAGMFTIMMVSFFLNDQLSSLTTSNGVWITPPLEELFKAIPFVAAVVMGRRFWRHPGLSDLMVLGFAVGGGYAFHEAGLAERVAASGFEANAGLLVPSILQPDGLFVVGHAVWTSVIGLAVGLLLLHRRQPLAVVTAVFSILAVVADHMSWHDGDGTLGWVRQLLFDGKLMGVIFVGGLVGAAVLDLRRQAAIGARDHLFPSDRSHLTRPAEPDEEDLLQPLLALRYRRRRAGIHNTVSATAVQWPPLSATVAPPVAELARLGRAADIAVGPGTSSRGWAPNPETLGSSRFVGSSGFTSYVAGPDGIAESDASSRYPQPADYWQYVGLGLVAIGLFTLVRLVTAGDSGTTSIEAVVGSTELVNSPALIRGLVGALAAGVLVIGRGDAVPGRGWDRGPGDDPRPDRPDECEA